MKNKNNYEEECPFDFIPYALLKAQEYKAFSAARICLDDSKSGQSYEGMLISVKNDLFRPFDGEYLPLEEDEELSRKAILAGIAAIRYMKKKRLSEAHSDDHYISVSNSVIYSISSTTIETLVNRVRAFVSTEYNNDYQAFLNHFPTFNKLIDEHFKDEYNKNDYAAIVINGDDSM